MPLTTGTLTTGHLSDKARKVHFLIKRKKRQIGAARKRAADRVSAKVEARKNAVKDKARAKVERAKDRAAVEAKRLADLSKGLAAREAEKVVTKATKKAKAAALEQKAAANDQAEKNAAQAGPKSEKKAFINNRDEIDDALSAVLTEADAVAVIPDEEYPPPGYIEPRAAPDFEKHFLLTGAETPYIYEGEKVRLVMDVEGNSRQVNGEYELEGGERWAGQAVWVCVTDDQRDLVDGPQWLNRFSTMEVWSAESEDDGTFLGEDLRAFIDVREAVIDYNEHGGSVDLDALNAALDTLKDAWGKVKKWREH